VSTPQQEKKPDYEIVTTLPESMGNIKEMGMLSTRKVFQEIIEHSEGKLLVSEPFIDNAFVEICLDQLRDASKRGVKLVLLTRKIDGDSSSLKALLRIYEIFSMNSPNKSALEVYEHWTPLKTQWDYSRQFVGLHAKLMINQVEAYIGSANWTEFSLGNNVEFGLLVRDVVMLRRLKELLELTMSQAQRIDIEKTHAKATSRGWR
jgi:phosphatidylserine/phosphatidylglycerophosphate/cardiolipin synthase-like enzyme